MRGQGESDRDDMERCVMEESILWIDPKQCVETESTGRAREPEGFMNSPGMSAMLKTLEISGRIELLGRRCEQRVQDSESQTGPFYATTRAQNANTSQASLGTLSNSRGGAARLTKETSKHSHIM
jgi:hypothetical protein